MDDQKIRDLQKACADLSDERLVEILMEGESSYEKDAWAVIAAEAVKRGVSAPVQAPSLPMDGIEEAVVFETDNLIEANWVRGILESNGIDVVASDDDLARLDPFMCPTAGGVRLIVRSTDYAKANRFIREYRKDTEAQSAGQTGPF